MKNKINITIPVAPRTKKNSQQLVVVKGRTIIIPSKAYKEYEKACQPYIPKLESPINKEINLKCLYFMPTRRKCDLNNLLEATTDILVRYKFLEDDNYTIVKSHDGSRVYYDKENPRVELEIEFYDWHFKHNAI